MLIEEDGVKTNSAVGLQSENKKTYFKVRLGTNGLDVYCRAFKIYLDCSAYFHENMLQLGM